MEDFVKITEKLLIKMIAINYKINEEIPLNTSDKEQMVFITKSARLFNKLNENLKIEKGKEVKDKKHDKLYEIFETSDQEFDFEGFSDYSDDNKSDDKKNDVKNETYPKIEKIDIVDEEITYETDPELIEICKINKIKFDELTKKLAEKLNNVQDSFWTTIDVV
jgi:hypothetical protein